MIIGLVGFKQVGKSTAAEYLAEKHGFARINFKDALVQEIKDGFPDLLREIQYIEGYINDKAEFQQPNVDGLFQTKPPLMRALMQNFGTEVRRKQHKDYWVQQWVKKTFADKRIVTDDVRFINEADSLKGRGGILIRLERPDIPSGGDHSSETEQLQIVADYTITVEKGEHEKLYKALDEIIEKTPE